MPSRLFIGQISLNNDRPDIAPSMKNNNIFNNECGATVQDALHKTQIMNFSIYDLG